MIISAIDLYKADHRSQYPINTQKVYSNWTPRSVKHAKTEQITVFGIQGFIAKRLIEQFKDEFFGVDKDVAVRKYARLMKNTIGLTDMQHIADLWDLQYLPLHIKALPEGVKVDPRVPVLTVTNTIEKFFWLVNYLETLFSCELWTPMTTLSIASEYYQIFKTAAERTGTPLEFVPFQGHDFSMRGIGGLETTAMVGAAHAASGFVGSDTLFCLPYLEEYYGADSDKELVICSVPATEHSVMCMGTFEGELNTFDRLLDLYPVGIVSIVSDTWDLWKVLTEYAPTLKDKIRARKPILAGFDEPFECAINITDIENLVLAGSTNTNWYIKSTNHMYESVLLEDRSVDIIAFEDPTVIVPGKTVFRPDSGCPVKILTGYNYLDTDDDNQFAGWSKHDIAEYLEDCRWEDNLEAIKVNGKYWELNNLGKELTEAEVKGAVEVLWDEFGGVLTSKGFKQLVDVGLIYGDSITLERAQDIMDRLADKGFASGNVVLGIGSFTYQYNTRDTYGFAMKATAGVVDGEAREIFKDPKTDDGLKKSLKGLIRVELEDGKYVAYDQQTPEQEEQGELQTVFLDGVAFNTTTLAEVRARVAENYV